MININDFYEFVFFVMNKEGKGSVTPTEFNIATYSALRTWTMQKYNNDAQYIPGQPIPAKGWQQGFKITDDLRHLLEKRELFVTNGQIPIPDGTTYDLNGDLAPEYLHISSLTHDYTTVNLSVVIMNVAIEILTDAEFSMIQASQVNKPTMRFPKATFRNNHLEVLPIDIKKAYLTYLRQPIEPLWSYILDVNNRPQYDALTSVDLDAPTEAFNDLAMLTLNVLGFNLRDGDISNYTQNKHQEGI